MEQNSYIQADANVSDFVYQDLLALISEKEILFETAIVYGSYAFDCASANSDLDVIVYHPTFSETGHIKCKLYGEINVSINLIDDASLGCPEFLCKSGLYYLSKFLSPYVVIYDKCNLSAQLFKTIFGSFLRTCFQPLLPNIYYNKELGAKQILALTYMVIGRVDYCYWVYFAKWCSRQGFEYNWAIKLDLVETTLFEFQTTEEVDASGYSLKFKSDNENIYSSIYKKQIYLERLTANFWQYYYYLHDSSLVYSENYFKKHLTLANEKIAFIQELHKSLLRQLNDEPNYLLFS